MPLNNDDFKKVKKIVKDEVGLQLDNKLGPKLEKVEKLITKSLDERLGVGLKKLEKFIKNVIAEDETLVRKDDIKNLPTKQEFFTKMDELITEVKTSRDEQTMLSHRVAVHSDQIERLEKHTGLPAMDI